MFKIKYLLNDAKALQKSIVFPEAAFSTRTQKAVKIIAKEKIAKPILIGDESAIILANKDLAKFHIINPKTFANTKALAKALYNKRKEKGLTQEQAEQLILDPYYFGVMLVEEGYADGMVAGAEAPTATTIRPALQIIKAEKKGGVVSSCFLVYGNNKFLNKKALILSDCGVIPNPTSDELVQIAKESLDTYKDLKLDRFTPPKIAFLSYSTHGSAKGEDIDKVKNACQKFKKEYNENKLGYKVLVDGEIQFDAAMVKGVKENKCPDSEIDGDGNILIYPDLASGNICYKAIQYFGGLSAVGPILQGLKKPVNDLSRGCSIDDIVVLTAVTALQSQKTQNKKEKK